MRRLFSLIGLAAVLWVGVAYFLHQYLHHPPPRPPKGYAVLLPAVTRNSWVVIERGNPRCPPLPPGEQPKDVAVPKNGYLCTSETNGPLWDDARFFSVEGERRAVLLQNKDLHSRGRHVFTRKGCAVDADIFFFGGLDEFLVQENMLEYVLQTRFPGCLR